MVETRYDLNLQNNAPNFRTSNYYVVRSPTRAVADSMSSRWREVASLFGIGETSHRACASGTASILTNRPRNDRR
jgi:hypothetical protein